MTVSCSIEPDLPAAEFIDVLVRSTLAERRTIQQTGTIRKMLNQADLIVTARVDGRLVGVSRAAASAAASAVADGSSASSSSAAS
jgi:hypothetical protein